MQKRLSSHILENDGSINRSINAAECICMSLTRETFELERYTQLGQGCGKNRTRYTEKLYDDLEMYGSLKSLLIIGYTQESKLTFVIQIVELDKFTIGISRETDGAIFRDGLIIFYFIPTSFINC